MCVDITYTQSDITFRTHLTVAMVWYRMSSGTMTSTMHRWNDDDVSVCSQRLIC